MLHTVQNSSCHNTARNIVVAERNPQIKDAVGCAVGQFCFEADDAEHSYEGSAYLGWAIIVTKDIPGSSETGHPYSDGGHQSSMCIAQPE
jgi:hypothetical protein